MTYLHEDGTDTTGSGTNKDPVALFDLVALVDQSHGCEGGGAKRRARRRVQIVRVWSNTRRRSYKILCESTASKSKNSLADLELGGFGSGDDRSYCVLTGSVGQGLGIESRAEVCISACSPVRSLQLSMKLMPLPMSKNLGG